MRILNFRPVSICAIPFETAESTNIGGNIGGAIDNKQLPQLVVVAVSKAMVRVPAGRKFKNS